MAASKTQVCNLALSHIGASASIANVDGEQSTEAHFCRLLYGPVRDSALRDHPWNFAAKRLFLADLGSPPPDWGYRYAYPNDCLKARRILPAAKGAVPPAFEIGADAAGTARIVLTDAPRAALLYTARIEDTNMFDPAFVDALSWRLAAELAPPLTGDRAIQQAALAVYNRALIAARTSDADEAATDERPEADWIKARA